MSGRMTETKVKERERVMGWGRVRQGWLCIC